MNKRQNTFFQMAAAVKAVVESFSPVWTDTPSFATPYTLLITDVLGRQPDAAAKQQTKTKGVTKDKNTARATLGDGLEKLAAAIEAYAISTGNKDLRRDSHIVPSGIIRASEDKLLGMAKRISALATAHLAALAPFGVTTARINALDLCATTFAGWIGKPRVARSIGVQGTQQLNALIALGRGYLDAMDGQMILFKDTAPEFCNQYFTARKLVPSGSHKRAVSVSVKDPQGHPLRGVAIRIGSLDVTRMTSAGGRAYIQHAAPGKYSITAAKSGYQVVSADLFINQGETARVDVVLQAEA